MINTFKTKFITLYCIIFTFILLTSCSPTSTVTIKEIISENFDNSLNNSVVNIDFWTYPRWIGLTGKEPKGQEGDWEKVVIGNFEKEHPNVNINLQLLQYDIGGPQQVNVAIASGNQPDILRDYPGRHFDYVNRNLILPLDDYISREEQDQYLDGILEQCTWIDGRQYLIPWSVVPYFLIVNKTLFEKAGADHLLPANEERTWTYDEFKNALKKVADPQNEIYGVGLFAANEHGDNCTVMLLENYGAKLIEFPDDNMPEASISSPNGIEAAAFIRSLAAENLCIPNPSILTGEDCERMFAMGKVAVLLAGSPKPLSSVVRLMELNKIDKFDIYPVMFPVNSNTAPVIYSGCDTYAVFKSGDELVEDISVEFCKYITSEKYINDIAPSFNIPAYKYADNIYKNIPYIEYGKKVLKYHKGFYYNVKGFTQIRKVLYPHIQDLFLNMDKSPEQIMNSLSADINDVIEKNYN